MDVWLAVIFALLGMAIGSFLNVCIDRLPARRSLVSPPSHCDGCQQRLAPLDMVPVFSYLALRGRCRRCRARIPRRILLVELAGGLLFLLAFWRFGLSPEFLITAFWSSVFLVIIFIDWEHKLILNKVTYPAAIAAVVILATDSLLPGPGILRNLVLLPQPAILSGIIGGAAGFVFFLLVAIISRGGIGEGDIKLAGVIGLALGLPMGVAALFIGIVIGGVVAVALLLLRARGRKDIMPYGTFLGLGPIIVLLWGTEIINWYLGLF